MVMDSVTPRREPITYRLALGDGWYRIRLNEHAETDVKTFLDVMFDAVPADQATATRALIETRSAAQILAARARDGIDLYIPAPVAGTGPMPALSIMTAEVVLPGPAAPQPSDVVATVASGNAAVRTGVIAGMPAVRIDHTAQEQDLPEQARDVPGLRHIEYLLPAANDPHRRWLSIALTAQPTPAHGQEETDTAVAAFDQTVTELAWCNSAG
jgi:hypothetical protein